MRESQQSNSKAEPCLTCRGLYHVLHAFSRKFLANSVHQSLLAETTQAVDASLALALLTLSILSQKTC